MCFCWKYIGGSFDRWYVKTEYCDDYEAFFYYITSVVRIFHDCIDIVFHFKGFKRLEVSRLTKVNNLSSGRWTFSTNRDSSVLLRERWKTVPDALRIIKNLSNTLKPSNPCIYIFMVPTPTNFMFSMQGVWGSINRGR